MNQVLRACVRASACAAVALSVLFTSAVSPPALADDPAMAKQLYMEARALMKEGRIRESLDKLKAAHDAFPVTPFWSRSPIDTSTSTSPRRPLRS